MKAKLTKEPAPPQQPIVVEIPPQVAQRMSAICDLSAAIKSLAAALAVPSASVTIQHCTFTMAKDAKLPCVTLNTDK